MKYTNTRRGSTQDITVGIKKEILANFSSGSSTPVVTKRQALNTLKPVQGLSNFTTTCGFTLIELLVVVLIIGILTAVALPQYQKAVTRSRLTAIKPLLFAIKNAHEASYLENGQYSLASAQKWLNLPNTCKTYLPGSNVYDCGHGFLINVYHSDLHAIRVFYCPGNEKNYSYCWTSARDFIYTIYLEHSTHPNWIRCESFTPLGQDICKTEEL